MFVSLDISILQTQILSHYKKEQCRAKAWYILLLTGQLSYIMVILTA